MSENKSCKDFMAAYKSDRVNCFTCRFWDTEDFVCASPEEVARRKKKKEFDELGKQMRRNHPVVGPL